MMMKRARIGLAGAGVLAVAAWGAVPGTRAANTVLPAGAAKVVKDYQAEAVKESRGIIVALRQQLQEAAATQGPARAGLVAVAQGELAREQAYLAALQKGGVAYPPLDKLPEVGDVGLAHFTVDQVEAARGGEKGEALVRLGAAPIRSGQVSTMIWLVGAETATWADGQKKRAAIVIVGTKQYHDAIGALHTALLAEVVRDPRMVLREE